MGLDTIEFILWAEKEFEVEISDIDAENILTIGQFTHYIQQKLLEIHGSNATSEAEIFERIRNYFVSGFKMKPEKISRSSAFVKDLGLDQ